MYIQFIKRLNISVSLTMPTERLGGIVRTRLVGAGIGLAIAAMTGFGAMPASADHATGHDATARAQGNSLQTRVDALEADVRDLQDQINAIPNAGDGPKTVFVTSGSWNGDLKTAGNGIDGMSGADNLCQVAANRSGKVPPGNYIA